ncbi:hypothetical protein JTB14_024303 [Gonioctena quinquepunctata]|nr:hypothetical protein JTB14_011936 [Gonioctena quinquepunctata]KAG5893103.1 hypothetical protein JTB14_024303 [Gonioctena quinquepunctata]
MFVQRRRGAGGSPVGNSGWPSVPTQTGGCAPFRKEGCARAIPCLGPGRPWTSPSGVAESETGDRTFWVIKIKALYGENEF